MVKKIHHFSPKNEKNRLKGIYEFDHNFDYILDCFSINTFISFSNILLDFSKLFSKISTKVSRWFLVCVGIKFTLNLAWPIFTTGNYIPFTCTPEFKRNKYLSPSWFWKPIGRRFRCPHTMEEWDKDSQTPYIPCLII